MHANQEGKNEGKKSKSMPNQGELHHTCCLGG